MRDYGNSSVLFQSTRAHVDYAFAVLEAFLSNLDEDEEVPGFEDVNTALFVTYTGVSDKSLRGCIGTLEPRPLHKALKDYALTSAGEQESRPVRSLFLSQSMKRPASACVGLARNEHFFLLV